MLSRRARRPIALLAASLLVVALVATAAASPRGSERASRAPSRATKTVRALVSRWSPGNVRISPGDRIRWKGVSGTHTVTAYGRSWRFNRSLAQGATVGRTFPRAGVFRFRCLIHSALTDGRCSGMCGKVVVTT